MGNKDRGGGYQGNKRRTTQENERVNYIHKRNPLN